ncbi:metallophosphoesterase domain-containing protein 1 [Ganoderma leucocontextum]|nr:metallophosphoesterase domain-containing protein 1 [Ganoderma leucocontextum]
MPSPTPTAQRTTLSDILFRKHLPDWWENFAQDPLLVIARRAFATCTLANLPPSPSPEEDDPQGESTRGSSSRPPHARVVCISDTHNRHAELPPLPPGDILIHAGDLTNTGTEAEIDAALAWLDAAPHPHKIVVAGNHDSALQVATSSSRTSKSKSKSTSKSTSETQRRDALLLRYPTLTYLEDSTTTLQVRGRLLCVHGSPRTPLIRPRSSPGVFQYAPSAFSWKRRLPPVADILVTHGPPAAHLDWRRGVGCPALLKGVWRTRPRLHVCGHVHAGRGVRFLPWSRAQVWFERACQPGAGWAPRACYTLLVVCAAAGTKLGRAVGRPGAVPLPSMRGTILVNAASAGGFGPDGSPHALQGPIVVDVPLPERL